MNCKLSFYRTNVVYNSIIKNICSCLKILLSFQTANCFELQLPASEFCHKADLTCILQENSSQPTYSVNTKTSAMNVSPDGVARYWQSITRPAAYVETSLNLNGQQCHVLQNIMVRRT